ncbi:MAG: hypothetical protein PUP92_19235 [Rhizonema sp. PD38]|nr:hypothetical protein [Rhizonema sp. PD38]
MSNPEGNKAVDSSDRVDENNYDRGITPAETAARKEREGSQFKTTPTEERNASAATDDQTNPGSSVETTGGYTVDKEGLLNNYAVEPEMYYETPGDAREQIEEDKANRVQELQEIKGGSEGELSNDQDVRGKGTGAI